MNRKDTAQVIADLYKARLTNNAEVCLKYFSDDAVFALAGSPETSSIVKAASPETSVRKSVEALVATWDWMAREEKLAIIKGKDAATRYILKAKHAPSGKIIETEIMDHIVFDASGKISKFTQFLDTAMIERIAH